MGHRTRSIYYFLDHVRAGEPWAIIVLVIVVFCAIGIVILTSRLFRPSHTDDFSIPTEKKRLRWPEDAPENKPWKTKKPGTP